MGTPNLDGLVKKPVLLSFYIASKVPVSESTRQELLEIDGISYRLRREIQLLECVDIIRCRNCRVYHHFTPNNSWFSLYLHFLFECTFMGIKPVHVLLEIH